MKMYMFFVAALLFGCGTSFQLTKDPNLDYNTDITISVIFHVLYSSEDQNIPTKKILLEFQDLSKDFMHLNTDTDQVSSIFKDRTGNPHIRFVLADTVLSEKGILRINSNSNVRNLYKHSPLISPEKYMNVYIGNLTKDGYTYAAPGGLYDAVNLNYQWIGMGYRLLTHEAGHWLYLYHTFEGGAKTSMKLTILRHKVQLLVISKVAQQQFKRKDAAAYQPISTISWIIRVVGKCLQKARLKECERSSSGIAL